VRPDTARAQQEQRAERGETKASRQSDGRDSDPVEQQTKQERRCRLKHPGRRGEEPAAAPIPLGSEQGHGGWRAAEYSSGLHFRSANRSARVRCSSRVSRHAKGSVKSTTIATSSIAGVRPSVSPKRPYRAGDKAPAPIVPV
jgi:hypothetical protein